MDDGDTVQALQLEVARMGERMNTHQAEYRTDIGQLAAKMAERDTEAAKRETRLLLTVVGVMVAGVTILGTVLGLLIRWPG